MKPPHGVLIKRWLAEPLPKDVALSIDRLAAADDVQHIAVMPDVHLSGDVCVGLAVATSHLLYPAAVGGDIGCGMAAVALDASSDLLADEDTSARLLTALARMVPAIKHPRETMPECLPPSLRAEELTHARLRHIAGRDGLVQLGTLGRGNHFLEFQADDEQRLWIMLHSGSRAMGQAITSHHVAVAERMSNRRRLPWLDAHMAEGAAYLADLAWAVRYAQENRLAMLRATEALLHQLYGVKMAWETLIHADHNHVRKENHFGADVFVHRKGSLPAGEGLAGVIPGSMGSSSFHVTGRGCEASLASSSHGAGRAMSRAEASQRVAPRELIRQMRGIWFDQRQVGRLCDEAPTAYKDIQAVMRAQRALTRIERRLRPLMSYKGV